MITTQYAGSLVPLVAQRRKIALQFHVGGMDGTIRNFYRTIPEIEPGASWIHDIQLNYYDYLSEQGKGWFADLETLAAEIPREHRKSVVVCLHGWYDYLGRYCYDRRTGKLDNEWIAFPRTRKTPMSKAELHKRIRLAKGLGFRCLLYFADGLNSATNMPDYPQEWVFRDEKGKTRPGWTGPSTGKTLTFDPTNPDVRRFYVGYAEALLDEYGREIDGLVWDETFYIEQERLASRPDGLAYADREFMTLVAEITCRVQERRKVDPELVFLTSDLLLPQKSYAPYALVSHGTYQDTAMNPHGWPMGMLPNYRNCPWSCNWYPVSGAANNRFAAEEYGIAQGVSNGWGDDVGPHEMPQDVWDALIARFIERAEDGADRTRYLVHKPVLVPAEKDGNVAGRAQVTASSEYDYRSPENFRAAGAVDGIVDGYPHDMTAEWASDSETVGAWLRLTWKTPQKIAEIQLFDRPHPGAHITSGQLKFSDGSRLTTGPLPDDAATPLEVKFKPKTVDWVEFRVGGVKPGSIYIGLSEFVVLGAGDDR